MTSGGRARATPPCHLPQTPGPALRKHLLDTHRTLLLTPYFGLKPVLFEGSNIETVIQS